MKLIGHLDNGKMTLGFLFVYTTPKKLPTPTRTALYGARAGGKHILPMGSLQIQKVADGAPLLEVLEDLHSQTAIVDADIRV